MMAAMRHIDDAERRSRLGRRHHLAAGHTASDVVALSGALCGLHATDPVTVFLTARARLVDFVPADLEHALYDVHTAIRMLGMRRTVFVVPTGDAPLVHQACTAKVAATNRARLVKLLVLNGVADDCDRWLADVERDVMASFAELGDATASELSERVPALRTRVSRAPGQADVPDGAINNQVLTQLAADGRIVRGRPTGAWSSTRYRWSPIDRWIDAPLDAMSADEADAALARRWLDTFGPAREADLKWWGGWTATQTRRALAAIDAVEVGLDTGTGWVLPDDLEPVDVPDPWVALLPALDPTPMGWSERGWYLGAHRERLFDRTGNIGPTIWVDGRIVGGWAQRPSGEVAMCLLEDIDAAAKVAIQEEGGHLEQWLGDLRFKPRFRTPLERELVA